METTPTTSSRSNRTVVLTTLGILTQEEENKEEEDNKEEEEERDDNDGSLPATLKHYKTRQYGINSPRLVPLLSTPSTNIFNRDRHDCVYDNVFLTFSSSLNCISGLLGPSKGLE